MDAINRSEATRAQWANPEKRANLIAGMLKASNTPEHKALIIDVNSTLTRLIGGE